MGLTDDELKAQMMEEAEAAIDAVLAKRKPAEAITLSEIEALALRAREQIGAKVAQVLVEASARRQPVPGPTCPQCGQEMHSKGKKRKRVLTAVGEVVVERDYFHCPTCKVGLFPPGCALAAE